MVVARRLVVSGRVPGVGFRQWTVAEARRAGLSGWVRNRPDGTVEIVAEGEAEAMAGFVDACRHGPSTARVEVMDATGAEPTGATTFEQRATG